MSLLFIILLSSYSLYAQEGNKIPADIQKKINSAIDHYNVSMYEKSKEILLELLYSPDGEKYEAEIRYHLGLACYWEGKKADALIQWQTLRKKYPTSKRSKELARLASKWGDNLIRDNASRELEFEFDEDLKFGNYFWNYSGADGKFLWEELKDPNAAIEYYEKLYNKYDDPNKKYKICVRLLALYGGYNNNNFGYNKQLSARAAGSQGMQVIRDNKTAAYNVDLILKRMEENITSETDVNFPSFIMWNYLWGIRVSGSDFWSSKVIANEESEKYFGKVIGLTNNNPHDIYRTFSILWLKDKAKEYIISDEEMTKYLSKGITNYLLYQYSTRKIPKEFWIELAQTGYDLSQVADDAAFIRSLKLERLLTESNLVKKDAFINLRKELKKLDGWDKLFMDHNYQIYNKELVNQLESNFNCNSCLADIMKPYIESIKKEIEIMSSKGLSKSAKRENQLFTPFSPYGFFIVMKLNNVDPKDFASLFMTNREKLYN